MTLLRAGRLAEAAILVSVLFSTAGAAHAATQTLVGVTSVRFSWAPASGSLAGYVVSRSLNLGAYQTYATTVEPKIAIPVKPGDQVSIRVAAAGYDSAGVYRVGPESANSDTVAVVASPIFPVPGSWVLRCSTTCNTVQTRSLANASLVLAQAPGLPNPWRVLGMARLQNRRDQIIWHNATTGDFSIYDGQFLAPIPSLANTGIAPLRRVGAADLDRDGNDEFVMQRTDYPWVVVGGILAGRFTLIGTIAAPSGATLAAVRDFDGNGAADLLWRDATGAKLDLWKTGGNPLLSPPIGSVRVASGLASDAAVASTGDYNGDGHVDVLWRYADGRLAISYLRDGVPIGYVALTAAAGDVDRRVAGSVDIGGTAGEEIALQENASGLIWILDPATSGATTRTKVVHPGKDWRVVGIGG